jgi:hypothetical protein
MEDHQYINLNPPYQRRLRWDVKRKSRLIESLLMNVPIPPVFLYETDLARYEVVDGQQRLSAIREFFNNEFALTGLEQWSGLNGRRFSTLPPRIKSGLNRRSLAAVILLAESQSAVEGSDAAGERDIKQYVFERLNTGGVRLNPQEIRNALYDGPFNRLLHELSRDPLFTSVWEIPEKETNEETSPSEALRENTLYRQMLDCEIVLRFFTLSEPEKLSTSIKASLDSTMKRFSALPQMGLDRWRSRYLLCLGMASELYAEEAFRLSPKHPQSRGPLSRALYDAVMIGLFRVIWSGTDRPSVEARRALVAQREYIAEETRRLMQDPAAYDLLVGRFNTKKSILERIELLERIFDSAARSDA